MAKLSDVLAERAKGDVQVGGTTITFSYVVFWREKFDDAEWTDLLASNGRDYLKRMLPRVVLDWNLVDDDGHAIPVTAEAIDQHNLPTALLVEIERRALNSDLSGKVRAISSS